MHGRAARRLLDDRVKGDPGRAVLTEAVRLAGAVVVARPGDEQAVPLRPVEQGALAVREVLAVVDLEAAEPGVDEFAERRFIDDDPARGRRRVRDDRDAAGRPDQLHPAQGRRGIVRLVVAGGRVQDPAEGGAPVGLEPAGDERVGDVRAADGRTVAGLRDHVVPGDRVVAADPFDHAPSAGEPAVADAGRLLDEARVGRVDEVAEHVDAPVPDAGAQLEAGHQRHRSVADGGDRIVPARGGVVVRQGDAVESGRGGCGNECGGALGAVGDARVGVQVDERIGHVDHASDR
ncbi:hypothetical protein Cus16_1090 [Curtobacterium sp. ER1/6]|nr:hypothetical protein Cus16_1090 [Curtobacterium sp. ER1/6]